MLTGTSAVAALKVTGFTDVVWIPDSALGTWEPALDEDASIRLIRVCREGEAFAVAAGLHLGGRQPLVVIQCTGLFEAGDSLRNFLHDLGLPLIFLVGVRSYNAHRAGSSKDTCPVYTEPFLQAWSVPYHILESESTQEDLERSLTMAKDSNSGYALLLAE